MSIVTMGIIASTLAGLATGVGALPDHGDAVPVDQGVIASQGVRELALVQEHVQLVGLGPVAGAVTRGHLLDRGRRGGVRHLRQGALRVRRGVEHEDADQQDQHQANETRDLQEVFVVGLHQTFSFPIGLARYRRD